MISKHMQMTNTILTGIKNNEITPVNQKESEALSIGSKSNQLGNYLLKTFMIHGANKQLWRLNQKLASLCAISESIALIYKGNVKLSAVQQELAPKGKIWKFKGRPYDPDLKESKLYLHYFKILSEQALNEETSNMFSLIIEQFIQSLNHIENDKDYEKVERAVNVIFTNTIQKILSFDCSDEKKEINELEKYVQQDLLLSTLVANNMLRKNFDIPKEETKVNISFDDDGLQKLKNLFKNL